MLELEKNSSKSTPVDDTSHSFTPTSNVRNGFRRKKGDSPFTYNLNLKVKKEKKQSNCTNPDREIFLKIICFWLLLKLVIRRKYHCTWDLLH